MMESIIFIVMLVFLIANIFLLSYMRYLLGELSFISENINSLVNSVSNFRDHLSDVYGLERFYGDETLENLLRHNIELVEILSDFEEIYSLTETEDSPEEELEVEEDIIGQPTDIEPPPTP